jgi:hypothetical protein
MASGRLGAADLVATTDTSLYTVPASTLSVVNVSICNRGAVSVAVRIAVVDGAIGVVANEDYIEFDTVIVANGVLERTGIVMAATHSLLVRSDTANVSAVAWGFEDAV